MKNTMRLTRNFLFFLLIIIGISIALGLGSILAYQSLLTPVSTTGDKRPFEVKSGESASVITDHLPQARLIKNGLAFRIFARTNNEAAHFSEGTFYLSPSMDAKTIAKLLTGSGDVDIKVTFIEGWRNEEYAQALQQKMGIDPKAFLAQAKQGYLFPDTYLFNKKEAVPDTVQTLENTFDKKVDANTKAQIQKQHITLDQGVILASIVERESHDSIPNERQMIASILLKRLRIGMPLETDATIQYALGYDPLQKTWWRQISTDELKTVSPYNTYLHTGLPPMPICNPGLASVQAVAQATDTPISTTFMAKTAWFISPKP